MQWLTHKRCSSVSTYEQKYIISVNESELFFLVSKNISLIFRFKWNYTNQWTETVNRKDSKTLSLKMLLVPKYFFFLTNSSFYVSFSCFTHMPYSECIPWVQESVQVLTVTCARCHCGHCCFARSTCRAQYWKLQHASSVRQGTQV